MMWWIWWAEPTGGIRDVTRGGPCLTNIFLEAVRVIYVNTIRREESNVIYHIKKT